MPPASPPPPAAASTKPVVLATMARSGSERLVLRLTRHQGRELFDARHYDDGDFPTKAGWSIEATKLPELRKTIEAATVEAYLRGHLAADLMPADLLKRARAAR